MQDFPDISNYLDYRRYLRDAYLHLKRKRRATHRSLMRKAGFAAPNFLKLVMDGQRNLTPASAEKMAKGFALQGGTLDYFLSLVRFNQSDSVAEKSEAFDKIRRLQQRSKADLLSKDQLEYWSEWHHVAIRELAFLPDFQEDPAWIVKTLGNKLSKHAASESLALLQRLELLKRNRSGRLKPTKAHVTIASDLIGFALTRFHAQTIALAGKALEEIPATRRNISSVTVTISQSGFQRVASALERFQEEVLAISEMEAGDALFQLNFQWFPLSEVTWHES